MSLHDDFLIDIEAQQLRSSDKGLLLDDGKVREWVPKSLVQDNGDGTFTMPEWLATDKGFV